MPLRRIGTAEGGFTLAEMLVVLAILGIVLAGLTQLFTGALFGEKDQTSRTQAQQNARLALDKLRREIHCASTVAPTSGYPASSVTITLGTWCSPPGGTTTVTWCTKDKNGSAPPVAGAQPYTLWRHASASCSGTGTQWVSNFVDKTDAPSITAGQIFNAAFVPAASVTSALTGGALASGAYSYEVTAVLASGIEVPGVVASLLVSSTTLTNKITLSWPTYAGATSYNVYGRAYSGIRLLKNVTSNSYVDTGPTSLTDNPMTVPSSGTFTVNVASISNFSAGANTIAFGPSVVTCTGTGTSPDRFTGCGGGQAGQYAAGTPVDSVSSTHPPRAVMSVSLALDTTPADTKQRFVLRDDIVLRNSRPF